jgi:mono/diheme cytochrome c family protein
MNETRTTNKLRHWSLMKPLLGLTWLVYVAGAVASLASQRHTPALSAVAVPPQLNPVERGRYLVQIAGCNDCHTSGYAQAGGAIPEQHWLTGDQLGYRGPWGTTYATNLRLYMQSVSEAQWTQIAQTMQTRPPMPWFVLHHMTPADLSAIYHFVKSLGPSGDPAPSYLPPEQVPAQPYVQFPGPPN